MTHTEPYQQGRKSDSTRLKVVSTEYIPSDTQLTSDTVWFMFYILCFTLHVIFLRCLHITWAYTQFKLHAFADPVTRLGQLSAAIHIARPMTLETSSRINYLCSPIAARHKIWFHQINGCILHMGIQNIPSVSNNIRHCIWLIFVLHTLLFCFYILCYIFLCNTLTLLQRTWPFKEISLLLNI